MNVLSPTTQQKVEDTLVCEGLINGIELERLKSQAHHDRQPVLSLLLKEGHINDEQLTKALAEVNNVPYVNLSQVQVDPKILSLLPQDLAEHYMAVPIGEMQ